MKQSILLFITFIFFTTNLTLAQNTGQEEIDDSGLYIGASIMGTSWEMPELSDETDTGGGIGLRLGYNFNINFAIFASFDGSSIDPDQGENYALGHFDLGAEGRFGDYSSKFRPFLRASFLGMSAQSNNPSGDIEVNGAGLGLGGGFYYFATNNLGLELSYTHSWVNVNEVKVGSTTVDVDEGAQTGRLALGISYHF